MLAAVNGYIDGNKVVVNESIANWQGRDVIVTILDSKRNHQMAVNSVNDKEKRTVAAKAIAGLWKNHGNHISVEDTVRNMRRARRFDT